MASNLHLLLIVLTASMVLLPLATADEPPKKSDPKVTQIVVEGVVECQSCKNYGSWGLSDAKPIMGAEVSVICKDHRNRVSFYKAFETDEHGYFYGQLDGFKMNHYYLDHPLISCKVKLVSSPLNACNIPTNINYGINGSPLRYENKRFFGDNYESIVYSAGPLAYRPGHCVPVSKH
ncbi:non-classical arabinogalactan protein 30 [Impatiens glandulifera]|uniref:non-classical arabinogalactan protein 30 n=1 Tax=Impatiens glandulifera TaxID=253017 RepID=UPI001FB11AB4|nr:non-classical arabinogalactan protein 30 [Impatiens glandulifera]